jgi:hypothetical protein
LALIELRRSVGNAALARMLSGPGGKIAPGRFRGSRGIDLAAAPRRIVVPFDGIREAGPGDVLITTGLANCVAVTVYEPDDLNAVMAHIQTVQIADEPGYSEATNEELLLGSVSAWSTEKLHHLKGQMLARLPDGKVDEGRGEWHVAVGTMWLNLGSGQARAARHDEHERLAAHRHSLVLALREVFGVEPESGGSTAVFAVAPGTSFRHPVSADEALPALPGKYGSGSGHPEMQSGDPTHKLNYL